ncbi:MAG: putative Ig domain-containing protein, partial [Planctomycetes bacterium]|nr:putative Ig domain-containing protein [Planctomycetota bacterium]
MPHPSSIIRNGTDFSSAVGLGNLRCQTPPPPGKLLLMVLTVAMLLLPSCHRTGSFNVTIPTLVICALSYELTQLLLIPLVPMEPLAPIIPDDTPCNPLSYEVDPPLPPGLSLDPTTGVISGTPTVDGSSTVHMISAVYTESFEDFQLTIVVLPFAPAFSYPQSEVVLTEGEQTILTPTLLEGSGAIDSWSVDTGSAPPLSAIVDSLTGELSLFGTGDFVATVTGSNEVGEAIFAITVTTVVIPRLAAPLLFLDDGDGVLGSGDQIRIETTVAVSAPTSGTDALAISSGSSLGAGSITTSPEDGFTLITLGDGALLHARGAAGAVGATTGPPQNHLPSYGTPNQLVATSNGQPLATVALDLFPGMTEHLISDQGATDVVCLQIDGQPSAEALVLQNGQAHLLRRTSEANWSSELIGGSELISIDAADIDCDGDT